MDGKSDQNNKLLVEKILLCVSVGATLGLLQLPYQKIDGNLVPTVIFNDNVSYFRAFVLPINFSFFGSFAAIALHDQCRRLSMCCLVLAAASLFVGIAVLTWLIMLQCVLDHIIA